MNKMLIVNPTPKDILRFFKKISIDSKNGCWNWMGSHDSGGYGHVVYNGKLESSHRVFYAWFKGSIPRNKGKNIFQLDHLCKNRKCVNPYHLELVSFKENILRGESPSAIHSKQIYCKNGHLLPKEFNYVRKNGKRERICQICKKEYHRKYMRKYRLSH